MSSGPERETNSLGQPAPAGQDAPTRLSFDAVTRRFGRHEVLHRIDLVLAPSQRIVLGGPNGSGKTTLLRLAAGLLRPTTGEVRCGALRPTDPAGRRGLGYVPQDAGVYAELTVREHLAWWNRVHGHALPRQQADDWLERAGLRRHAEQRAVALSRGQRQRLAIAMSLSPAPDLLLLDEPTTALDDAGRAWLHDELSRSSAAMLIASHEVWPDASAKRVRLLGGRIEGAA